MELDALWGSVRPFLSYSLHFGVHVHVQSLECSRAHECAPLLATPMSDWDINPNPHDGESYHKSGLIADGIRMRSLTVFFSTVFFSFFSPFFFFQKELRFVPSSSGFFD